MAWVQWRHLCPLPRHRPGGPVPGPGSTWACDDCGALWSVRNAADDPRGGFKITWRLVSWPLPVLTS